MPSGFLHNHHPHRSLWHTTSASLRSGAAKVSGAALHPDVGFCPHQPPGHKSKVEVVCSARNPEQFVQPVNPKLTGIKDRGQEKKRALGVSCSHWGSASHLGLETRGEEG